MILLIAGMGRLSALNLDVGSNTIISSTVTYDTVTFQPNSRLTVTDSAQLTVNNILSPTNASTLIFNGQTLLIASGGLFIPSGGLVYIPIPTFGAVSNEGVLIPSQIGSIDAGTCTVTGDYTQTASGSLRIKIASPESNDLLLVNGSVLLGGTLVVTGANGYTPQFGDRYTFINSTGPIKGEFSSIVMPSADLRGRVIIIGDPQAVLLIAPASYTQLAQNRNQMGVATALDSFIPATSGDQLVISTSLDSLSASEYNQAFNAIMPTFYQQIATIAFNEANALNMEFNQRLWGLRVAEGGGFSMSGLADNMPILEGQGDGKGVLDSKKDILRPGLDNH